MSPQRCKFEGSQCSATIKQDQKNHSWTKKKCQILNYVQYVFEKQDKYPTSYLTPTICNVLLMTDCMPSLQLCGKHLFDPKIPLCVNQLIFVFLISAKWMESISLQQAVSMSLWIQFQVFLTMKCLYISELIFY